MGKHRIPPGGGAMPTRPPEKMGAEHAESIGPWRGAWGKMMKRTAVKKSRQRSKQGRMDDDA